MVNTIKSLSERPKSKLEDPFAKLFHSGVWPEEPYEIHLKNIEKRNLIKSGSDNTILENLDFCSFGIFWYFGVGGSIHLVKLVCLLLARASQVPYTA